MTISLPALKIEKLNLRFDGIKVLDQVTLEIPKGKCVGLVGENGCGKTSFLNLISGIERPDSGVIYFSNGKGLFMINQWPTWQRAREGLLQFFQTPRIWKNLTPREHILACASNDWQDSSVVGITRWFFSPALRKRGREKCLELLELVGLQDYADNLAGELSFGQMKLLALAMLLATPKQRLLLLDEPTAGINPAMADRMVGLFHDIKMQGVGILVVEHDRSMMAGLTDCIYELRGAQLFPLGKNG